MAVISKCYICNKNIIAEHSYDEHIILNSLGGKLKSKSLMCRPCSVSFDNIDTELSDSLNLFGLLLSIKRDRGENPRIKAIRTDNDKEIFIESGGKPAFTDQPIIEYNLLDDKQFPIYIKAKNEPKMRQILEGFKRKNPSLNVEEILNSAVSGQETIPIVHPLKNILFNDKQLRSICKMAINFYMHFYVHHEGKRDLITHLIPYIKGECKNQYVNYYYPDEPIVTSNLSEDSFIHTLFIKGNPEEKILYGYIELYSAFRLIILLSDAYEESFFQKVYSFDVLSRKKVDKEININLSRKKILDVVNNPEPPVKQIDIAIKDLQKGIVGHLIYHQLVDNLKNILQEANFDEKMVQELIEKYFTKEKCNFIYRLDPALRIHEMNQLLSEVTRLA